MRGIGFALLALLAGCATTPARTAGPAPVIAKQSCPHIPPPPAGEARPVPPRSGFPQVLQPGYWSWSGHDYTRLPPRWLTLLARHKPLWQPEYWSTNGGACVWNEAHFVHGAARHRTAAN